jgi:hypothetical protein
MVPRLCYKEYFVISSGPMHGERIKSRVLGNNNYL